MSFQDMQLSYCWVSSLLILSQLIQIHSNPFFILKKIIIYSILRNLIVLVTPKMLRLLLANLVTRKKKFFSITKGTLSPQ